MLLCAGQKERLHPSGFTPPLLLKRWATDPERKTLCTAWLTSSVSSESTKWTAASIWTIFMFTFSLVELALSQKTGVMTQCCCRQVLLGVELGILVAVLVAGSAGQIHDRREAGSSCYGGFDLYFVLDK